MKVDFDFLEYTKQLLVVYQEFKIKNIKEAARLASYYNNKYFTSDILLPISLQKAHGYLGNIALNNPPLPTKDEVNEIISNLKNYIKNMN